VNVVLLQCELEHRHQAPHLAGSLFSSDLRRTGHSVRCALVHPSALDEAAARYREADLLLLDSIFPFALIRRLRERTTARIVVGGHNALQHALRGPAALALVGAARHTLPRLVQGLEESTPLSELPGLWFRTPDGVLDCGPPAPPTSPAAQISPFTPDLQWEYLGPPRAPGSNLRVPSVVAELGCVWSRSALRAGSFYDGVSSRRPDVDATPRALARLDSEFVQQQGGCTFCTFRYQQRRGHQTRRTIELVLAQARVLVDAGARGLSLQTEHPLPWLGDLLDALASAGLAAALDELHVRTIPWLLLRHEASLQHAITRARAHGIQLVLAQVGFEAFDSKTLEVYNKGLSVHENRSAARLLGQLHHAHAPAFLGTGGHGLVPLHPWSTPEAVRANIAACREDAPWLVPSLTPFARIELYNEWTPLFWKASDAGLVRPDPDGFGWTWEYEDPRMGELTAASASILAQRGLSHEVMDAVAALLIDEPDPQNRRQAYLALRG
jgi:hypothetical protein